MQVLPPFAADRRVVHRNCERLHRRPRNLPVRQLDLRRERRVRPNLQTSDPRPSRSWLIPTEAVGLWLGLTTGTVAGNISLLLRPSFASGVYPDSWSAGVSQAGSHDGGLDQLWLADIYPPCRSLSTWL